MTTQTPQAPKNAPQSLPVVPTGDYWQVIPPRQDSLLEIVERMIRTTEEISREIEKIKSML